MGLGQQQKGQFYIVLLIEVNRIILSSILTGVIWSSKGGVFLGPYKTVIVFIFKVVDESELKSLSRKILQFRF